MDRSPAIKKLPSEVQALLRSGNVITNASQCVTELVLNAVDARSTRIAVRINFNYHKIQVADNGCGMSGEELDLIGERFMTSKCHSINDLEGNLCHYGFRGEALASLKECSGLLTLESRPEGSDTTYAKVFAHGKTHSSGTSKNSRPACGTTVTAHDFMYNMPVRRGRIQPDLEIEEIKSHLESIALIHPEVSFSLHNEVNRQLLMQTHKSADSVGAFSQLFNKTLARSLVPVSYSMGECSVNGYIGKETHNRKNLQFIYVNKRLVLKTKLHKIANTVLGMSFLLRHKAPPGEVPACKDYTTDQWLFFSTPDRDRYAVYLFNIVCPYKDYDICFEPKKTLIEFKDWKTVLECLESAINMFLQTECNTFSSREKSNVQSKVQDESLLAEVSLLDKEYALGKYVDTSQKSNQTEPSQPTQHIEANFNVKKQNQKCLPGIHKIFGAVCGAQAKRKNLNNNEASCTKSTGKHKLEDEDEHILSPTAVVLHQVEDGRSTPCMEKSNKNKHSLISTLPQKTLILDHSKSNNMISSKKHQICEKEDPLKLKHTTVNLTERSYRAKINSSMLTDGLSECPVIEPSDIECSAASSVCPIVKFRRKYESTNTGAEKVLSTDCNGKMSVQEETSTYIHPISKFKQTFGKNFVTGDDENKYISKRIRTKSIAVQHFDSSISGISEVPLIESQLKCSSEKTLTESKAFIHPIQRFRRNVAKRLSHKDAVCHSALESTKSVTLQTECNGPKSKHSSWQKVSATKCSLSINSTNQTNVCGNNRAENTEHFKFVIGKSRFRNQTSDILEEKHLATKVHQPDIILKEMANKSEMLGDSRQTSDHIFKIPLPVRKVKHYENSKIRHSSLAKAHSYCSSNSRSRTCQVVDQRISLNKKNISHNSNLLPLWSLGYLRKRKCDLQMSTSKKCVHCRALGRCDLSKAVSKYENASLMNGFKDSNSRTTFKDTDRKYLTSSDFLHTLHINKHRKDSVLKHHFTWNQDKTKNKTSLLYAHSLESNFMKHFPTNWKLKSEDITSIVHNKKCYVSPSMSFIFSPKQDFCSHPLTFNEMFSKTEISLKGSHNNGIHENIGQAFSTDIMKHCTNIITLSSGSEADIDSAGSLKSRGPSFLTIMSHHSSERDVNATPETINHICDFNRSNFCNSNVARDVITPATVGIIRQSLSQALKDISPHQHHHHETIISPEVAQNTEENSLSTLKVHDKDSDPETENRLEVSYVTVPNDESPPSECQKVDNKSASVITLHSSNADISRLLSQRVLEDSYKSEDENPSIIEISSDCISPLADQSSDVNTNHIENNAHPIHLVIEETSSDIIDMTPEAQCSDVNTNHVENNVHPKHLVIEETSSDIIDMTPQAISKELFSFPAASVLEKCNAESSVNNAEKIDSMFNFNKQDDGENSTNNKIECDDKASPQTNRYNEQERKRCSSNALGALYGKRLSLETNVSDCSLGTKLSGCTEILNQAFDMLTQKIKSDDQMQANDVTVLGEEIATNKNMTHKKTDDCVQVQEVSDRSKLVEENTEVRNKTDDISLDNCHTICHNATEDCDIRKGANEELVSESAQKLIMVSENACAKGIERENADVCDKVNEEASCPEEWEKTVDSTGRQFYIHKESGMPSFCIPYSKSAGASYSMSERYGFLPKGLSPILKGNCNNMSKDQDILTPNTRHAFHNALIQDNTDALDELKHVKWREIQDFKNSDCRDLLKTLVEDSEYSMQFYEKGIPSASSKELPKRYNSMFSYTFNRETFSTLKVLGQLDRKFIVAITMCEEKKLPRYIVLFDQHAVHERIRVEQLMKEYQEEESDTKFKTSVLDNAITLSLGKDDIRILQSFRKHFENLGIHFEILSESAVKVSNVPTCLLMRENREYKNQGASILKTLLENLIREQIDCLVATRGSAARVPKTLQAVVNSEACKGALKFGDELTTEECGILLTSLSSCKLPFHCAHGRPALTPIVDLLDIYAHQKPVCNAPNLQKLKKLFAE